METADQDGSSRPRTRMLRGSLPPHRSILAHTCCGLSPLSQHTRESLPLSRCKLASGRSILQSRARPHLVGQGTALQYLRTILFMPAHEALKRLVALRAPGHPADRSRDGGPHVEQAHRNAEVGPAEHDVDAHVLAAAWFQRRQRATRRNAGAARSGSEPARRGSSAGTPSTGPPP